MNGPVPKRNVSMPGLYLAKNKPQSSDLLIKKAKALKSDKNTLNKLLLSELSAKYISDVEVFQEN